MTIWIWTFLWLSFEYELFSSSSCEWSVLAFADPSKHPLGMQRTKEKRNSMRTDTCNNVSFYSMPTKLWFKTFSIWGNYWESTGFLVWVSFWQLLCRLFSCREEGCRQAAEALGCWAIFKAGSLSHLHEYPVFLADYPRWHETNLGKCSYSWSAAAELKSPHPNLQTKLGLQRMWKLFLSRPSQRFSNILWQPHTYYMLWKSSLSFIAFKHLNFYVSFLGP